VNNNPADGCEVTDTPTGNHTQASAVSSGNVSDCDSGGIDFTITGHVPSDARVHENPAVVGFDATAGDAPDWTSVFGVGHPFCSNDLVVTLQVTGSAQPSCYSFTAITDKFTYTCQTNATGTCNFNYASGSQFSDNTTIYFEVKKTCTVALKESPTYSISGHL
jgi:hypothetical protein